MSAEMAEKVAKWNEAMAYWRYHACDHLGVGRLDQAVTGLKDALLFYEVDLNDPAQARAFALGHQNGMHMSTCQSEEQQTGFWHVLGAIYPLPPSPEEPQQ